MTHAITIDLTVNRSEDRICMTLSDGEESNDIFLTRRMLGLIMAELGHVLVNHFGLESEDYVTLQAFVAHHFGQSHSAISQKEVPVPKEAEMNNQDSVLVNAGVEPSSPLLAKNGRPLIEKPYLISTVHLKKGKEVLIVELVTDAGDTFKISFLYSELHGFVDIIYRKSIEAEWALEAKIPWLKEAYFPTNPSSASIH